MDLTEKVNEVIRIKLESMNCISGKLNCAFTTGTLLVIMQGKREGQEKPVFFWEWTNKETPVLREYLERNPDWQSFQLDADLEQNTFVYTHTTRQEHKQKEEEAAEDYKIQEATRQAYYKKMLLADKALFGKELSEKVTARLDKGDMLAYGHRDYCGRGLWRNDAGYYCYGFVWDYALEEDQVFKTRSEFVEWLAAQSNASLSMAESPNPFYHGNQVITKQRLEEFVN